MAAGAGYSYIVLPGKNANDTAAYAASPAVQILQNDASAQAVLHAALGIQAVNFWTPGSIAGITSDGIACVVTHQANGLLNIAVADPTQANMGVIHIEVAVPASSVVSQDAAVTVDQTSPTVKLSVNANKSQGKSFRVSLALNGQ